MTTDAERLARAFDWRRLSLALAILCAAVGCRKRAESNAERESSLACASACATLVGSGCAERAEAVDAQRGCVSECLRRGELSRAAGCGREHLAYLSCVGASSNPGCDDQESPAKLGLETDGPLPACATANLAYRACTRPCRQAGVVHTGSGLSAAPEGQKLNVQAEVVGLGCGDAAPLPSPKARAGSPCTHHSVCTAARCECPGGRGAYSARACVGGRCAQTELACRIAPTAVGHDVCRRADGS
jgi:hypothetical protein